MARLLVKLLNLAVLLLKDFEEAAGQQRTLTFYLSNSLRSLCNIAGHMSMLFPCFCTGEAVMNLHAAS